MLLKKRYPRVDRDVQSQIKEDENQHLWAVSYADFLMAILSFFILFFSVDSQDRDSILQRVSLQFGDHVEAARSLSSQTLPSNFTFDEKTLRHLKDFKFSVANHASNLVIDFPDKYFSPGKYELGPEQAAQMDQFLDAIKPYAAHLKVYFEGHADSNPVSYSKTAVLTDNFVLSSLRATSAVQYSKKFGLQEKQLFVEGSAANNRNSRSLSVRLVVQQGEQ